MKYNTQYYLSSGLVELIKCLKIMTALKLWCTFDGCDKSGVSALVITMSVLMVLLFLVLFIFLYSCRTSCFLLWNLMLDFVSVLQLSLSATNLIDRDITSKVCLYIHIDIAVIDTAKA